MFPSPPDAAGLTPAELARIMRWYIDMGVDAVVEAEPRDRFADSVAELARTSAAAPATAVVAPAPRAPLARPEPPPPRPHPPAAAVLSQDAVARSAREAAAGAKTLDELRAALEAFDGCALKRTASRLVFADGDPKAKIMLIGEAPGADEDRQGLPFVGKAGQMLDKMLAAIGLERGQVYIANVIPWRPPGNRDPSPQETAICLPFIHRQIALVNPRLLVCLGKSSAQTLLGIRDGILRARGNWYDLSVETDDGERVIKSLATLHPAYLLRSPAAKRLAWRDLRALRKAMDEPA